MTVHRPLLLSLRPRFAEAILAGDKTVEVRRRPINASAGVPVILYASSPRRAVVGTARLANVECCEHEVAWRRYRHTLGLSRDEFDTYLAGTSAAFLLRLRSVCTLNEPLALDDLRDDGPFRPPQSFRYVADSDPGMLRRLVALVKAQQAAAAA